MLTADFDFHLPESAIAQAPLERGQSRLLVLDAEGEARHRRVSGLVGILRPGDLLVVNDTRVIPARLYARRASGGRSELLLLEKTGDRRWLALAKPAKRLRPGAVLRFEASSQSIDAETASSESGASDPSWPTATVLEKLADGRVDLEFDRQVEPHLDRLGHVPLPPYIRRADRGEDRTTYQTVYAREDGAVAAPTAGLHFSDQLLGELEKSGVERASVTLHVGIGTFRPVSVDAVAEHRMDAERYTVPEATAEAIARTRERRGRVVAVGTTVVRSLESAVDESGSLRPGSGRTELFITPGFRFQAVDALLTNFHLPRSTLLMMVSAFAGRERVLAAYAEAVDEGYRFYSYGDAMFAERRDTETG